MKYLYNNLYKKHSFFVKQNIYPVCEFLKKGYSIKECERIVNILPDANGKTVFCYDNKEINYKYNKLFNDLIFAFNRYEEYLKDDKTMKQALKNIEEEIDKTDSLQREKMVDEEENIILKEESCTIGDEYENFDSYEDNLNNGQLVNDNKKDKGMDF